MLLWNLETTGSPSRRRKRDIVHGVLLPKDGFSRIAPLSVYQYYLLLVVRHPLAVQSDFCFYTTKRLVRLGSSPHLDKHVIRNCKRSISGRAQGMA